MAVAWAISDREDELVMKVLFQALKNRCPEAVVKTLMSDDGRCLQTTPVCCIHKTLVTAYFSFSPTTSQCMCYCLSQSSTSALSVACWEVWYVYRNSVNICMNLSSVSWWTKQNIKISLTKNYWITVWLKMSHLNLWPVHFTHCVTKGMAPEAPGLCPQWWTSTRNLYLFVATDDGRKWEWFPRPTPLVHNLLGKEGTRICEILSRNLQPSTRLEGSCAVAQNIILTWLYFRKMGSGISTLWPQWNRY